MAGAKWREPFFERRTELLFTMIGTWGILCNSVASNPTYLEEETKDYARHFFGDGSSFRFE
jgi:hypothetical protein